MLEEPFYDGYNEDYDRCLSYLMAWDVEGEITNSKKRMVGTGVPVNEINEEARYIKEGYYKEK